MTLVSAILPTRGRHAFARQAVECFQSQTYLNKELVILDDEDAPSFQQGLTLPQVIYVRHKSRSIAQKRNIAAGMSQGEIICHFDSDDWSAPERIANQLETLQRSGLPVAGYHSMYFYSEDGRAFWYDGAAYCDSLGTSLMYTREWWHEHPFWQPRTPWGEDNEFTKYAKEQQRLSRVSAELLMVARAHADNTAAKNLSPESIQYQPVDVSRLPAGFPR